MRRILLPLILVCLQWAIVRAQTNRWEKLGAIDYSSLARSSESSVVATTTHGFLYISTDFGQSWEHRYVDDTLALEDVQFVDPQHAMVISWDGTVLSTNDGMNSWSRSHVARGALTRIAYPALDTAYIADRFGLVSRTTDRGKTWHSTSVSSTVLNGIYFFDSRSGFAVGKGGFFAATNNAGQTWVQQDIGGGDTTDLYSLDFHGRDTGVVAGFGYVFSTTNGGTSWTRRPTPVEWHNRVRVIKLTSNHAFFAFGAGSHVYNSSDLGATWDVHSIHGDAGADIKGIVHDEALGDLIVGSHGTIAKKSRSAGDWVNLSLLACDDFSYTQNFGDTILGIRTSSQGNVFFRSVDSGLTWQSAGLNAFPWIGLYFRNSQSGLAIYANTVTGCQATTDGGRTWTNAGITDTVHVSILGRGYDYFSAIGNIAYVSGSDSVIEVSTDFGKTWATHILSPVRTSPYPDAEFYSVGVLKVVADSGGHAYALGKYIDKISGQFSFKYHLLLFETNDTGRTWRLFPNAPSVPYANSVYFWDRLHGYLTCDGGILYRTSDGGDSWSRIIVSEDHSLTAIRFVNDSLGFCASNASQIFRTTDAGITWVNDSLRIPYDGNPQLDLSRQTYTNGFLLIDSATIIATTSHGFYRRSLQSAQRESVSLDAYNAQQYLYIHAFPIPAANVIHCQLDGMYVGAAASLRCALYDLLGRQVQDFSALSRAGSNGYTSTFDARVTDVPSGVYELIYEIGNSRYARPVIIHH